MHIVIPLYPGFTALDAVGPYEVLQRLPGADLVFAAATTGPVRADTGRLALTADAALADITACDMVCVPGGPTTRGEMEPAAEVIAWLRAVHPTTTWTASVCTGSLLLGAAGLLDGLDATTHWSAVDLLESFGATYRAERYVIGGKIATSAGVSAGIDLALDLASRIAGDTVAQAIQLTIEYDPAPPFDSGSVAKAPAKVLDLLRERARRSGAPQPALNRT